MARYATKKQAVLAAKYCSNKNEAYLLRPVVPTGMDLTHQIRVLKDNTLDLTSRIARQRVQRKVQDRAKSRFSSKIF
jgi:hypothetical protein